MSDNRPIALKPVNVIGISGLHHSVPFKKREFPDLSPREYRIAQGFDSAAALVTREGIQAVAAEERFTREKTTGSFPVKAIHYCLQEANLALSDIDYIAHGFSYESVRTLFEHDEFLQKQFGEVYSHETQIQSIEQHLPSFNWSDKLVPVPHHAAHAASAFYLSGFEESLIVVVDGMGEVDSMTIAVGRGRDMEVIKKVPALHSLGVLYGVVTMHLGFFLNLDEYKVMGLAPYGNPRRYFNQVMQFIRLKNDGTYTVPLLAEDKTLLEKETHRGVLEKLTEVLGPPREPEAEITQEHKDIAAAMQTVLQASLMHTLRFFKKETGQDNLCMAGGVALNCSANGVIKRSKLFRGMFIQPAAGDDGSALGAALYAQNRYNSNYEPKRMTLPLWGPSYSDEQIEPALKAQSGCTSTFFQSFDKLVNEIVRRLIEGQIIAWYQGRMEFGPRALGSRSILADPRDPEMRERINALVKKREGFRPFAPAVTSEAAKELFDIDGGDESVFEHMLYVVPVRTAYRTQLPAITHVDGSARIQTVPKDHNPRFWTLINEFGKETGIPVVLNTSFNVRGQPIVCTPTEAVETFLMAGLDALAIGNYLVVPEERA